MNEQEKLDALRRIEGLHVDTGLKTIANMASAYLRVLGLYIKKQAQDEGLLNSQLNNSDFEAFRTTIHGYKSALANIGATMLSEKAARLEEAAKDEDSEYIGEHLELFEYEAKRLSDSLKAVLE
jgi:HPt (histidine-containing phosphotransfer) domain-containing protein